MFINMKIIVTPSSIFSSILMRPVGGVLKYYFKLHSARKSLFCLLRLHNFIWFGDREKMSTVPIRILNVHCSQSSSIWNCSNIVKSQHQRKQINVHQIQFIVVPLMSLIQPTVYNHIQDELFHHVKTCTSIYKPVADM